jgi:hypothetical protein
MVRLAPVQLSQLQVRAEAYPGGSGFAHHYSEFYYCRQFAGYRAISGDRNVLECPIRQGSDELTYVDMDFFRAQCISGQ